MSMLVLGFKEKDAGFDFLWFRVLAHSEVEFGSKSKKYENATDILLSVAFFYNRSK